MTPVPSTPDTDNPGTPGDPGVPTEVVVPADPALSFAKTGVLSADGNTIEYTFTVTNTGNVTMDDITVSDPKITDPIVLDATTLAPGQIATGTATYTITQTEKDRSEEHTYELQSLMRLSYSDFCLKKKNKQKKQ